MNSSLDVMPSKFGFPAERETKKPIKREKRKRKEQDDRESILWAQNKIEGAF
jgi:hypothetical protein